MVRKWFTEHPDSVGETYFEHQRMAFGFAVRLVGAGLACAVHGLFPALFTRTGSSAVRDLHRRMVEQRMRAPRASATTIRNEAR